MAPNDASTLVAKVGGLTVNDDTANETPPSELVGVVDDLLNQLNSKFNNLSGELLGKMDEMSRRLDHLEANIAATNTQNEAESEG